MSFLIDTNIISELRKRDRCEPSVARWFSECPEEDIYLSVLTIGEITRGIENIRRRDPHAAASLDRWLKRLQSDHADRILPVDHAAAEEWGRLNVPDPIPVVDGLLAATAKVRGMTFVTRNTHDVERTGVDLLNPFVDG